METPPIQTCNFSMQISLDFFDLESSRISCQAAKMEINPIEMHLFGGSAVENPICEHTLTSTVLLSSPNVQPHLILW